MGSSATPSSCYVVHVAEHQSGFSASNRLLDAVCEANIGPLSRCQAVLLRRLQFDVSGSMLRFWSSLVQQGQYLVGRNRPSYEISLGFIAIGLTQVVKLLTGF